VIADIEKLQRIVFEAGLPRQDRALYGLKCPYCGKSDRIRELEPAQALEGALDLSVLSVYKEILCRLALPGSELGVCKFCQSPLRIPSAGAQAVPLTE